MKPGRLIVVYDAAVRSRGSVSVMYDQRVLSAVTVALLAAVAAVPAMAASPPVNIAETPTIEASAMQSPKAADRAYWAASNYRGDVAQPGLRRIVLSGYHPVTGFEEEVTKERQQMQRSHVAAATTYTARVTQYASTEGDKAVARER